MRRIVDLGRAVTLVYLDVILQNGTALTLDDAILEVLREQSTNYADELWEFDLDLACIARVRRQETHNLEAICNELDLVYQAHLG